MGKISIEGEMVELYKRIKDYVQNKPEKLSDTVALKKFYVILPHISLFLVEETSKEIIIKEGSEIIIPSTLTKELVDILHETHLSGEGMKHLARDKF